jgi:UDP-N-acetylmuramoyl-L-alanyl-D-glutamate--2,6-diaminopimelate ligase
LVTKTRPDGPRRLAELFNDDVALPERSGDLAVSGLSADSRAITAGMVFAALPGTKVEGAQYVPQASEAGAVAILAGTHARFDDPGIPVIRVADPRRALALAAARFFRDQPDHVVAITGTNGKTSVAVFLRQIWERAGHRAASWGTTGLTAPGLEETSALTSPDPVALHEILAQLAGRGVTHMALEASSHGLDQRRLDGLDLAAGAFTNFSRDHLDYHVNLDAYLAAKLRLFDTILPEGAAAVVDADQREAERVKSIARRRGLDFMSVGESGQTLKLRSLTRMPDGARLLVIDANAVTHYVTLPLVGRFQVSNALVAAALAIATGVDAPAALDALRHLRGASGRLECVGRHRSGGLVFVDYAHTPEALVNALAALRPYTSGRLIVLFGAGGDRDPGKRVLMGEAVARHADVAIITDDNPRGEDPAAIRAAILKGAPEAEEIGDRGAAIGKAVAGLKAGDVLLIAGKGHETGQTIGDVVHPFSDQEEARAALAVDLDSVAGDAA